MCSAALTLLSASGSAAPIAAQCTPDFTSCGIPENVLLQLPFLAISGDVVLLDPHTSTVSDVFRIFNDVVNTGQGTGLGATVFLFSSDDSTPLPNPATYSANVVTIMEDPSGFTHFLGNGTDYVLGIPEPGTIGFMGLGLVMMAALAFKRENL